VNTYPSVSPFGDGQLDPRAVDAAVRLLPGDRPVRTRFRLTGGRPEWKCAEHGNASEPRCAHLRALQSHIERNTA